MRLVFGDPASLKLLDQAPRIVSEYSGLARAAKRTRIRIWWRQGARCAVCEQSILRDQLLVFVGRRQFHDDCLVRKLVDLRKKLKALGYRIDAGGAGLVVIWLDEGRMIWQDKFQQLMAA